MKEGKTLQLLQERLVGSNGIRDLRVDESRTKRQTGTARMFLVPSRALTDQEIAAVQAAVNEVNLRFGAHIYAFIVNPTHK